jgi:nucleoside-diphosphate-sugar epimerase
VPVSWDPTWPTPLLAAGHEVAAFDNLSTGSIDNIEHLKPHPRFRYTIDSVQNEPVLAEQIDRCDVVFHLAAAVGVKKIVEEPVHTIENNVHGTEVVLAPRQQEEAAGGGGVDVRGLRQEHRRPVPRGRRPGDGADLEAPLGLRLQQG